MPLRRTSNPAWPAAPESRSGLRPSSIALVLALLFVLAGLIAVDRSISVEDHARANVEVVESSALVQGFLAVHAEALQGIRGIYLDTTRDVNPAYFRSLTRSMTPYATAFQRIWITDTAGRLVEEHAFNPVLRPLPLYVDLDTASLLGLRTLAAQARRDRHTQVSGSTVLPSGRRGIVMLEPIYVGSRFAGFAGATITSAAIIGSVRSGRPQVRGHLVILAGSDTIAAMTARRRFTMGEIIATSPLRVPGGGAWRVVIIQHTSFDQIRALLWSVGLATLVALGVILLHERRQQARLAERSAELEHLSLELLRANRAKSEFLANVSHELRTPLNAIVGFVELLRDGVYGALTPRQIPPVERMASSAAHLRQLVDQILDLAKMAAGRLEVHPEQVDLRLLVMDVAGEMESLVMERGLNLSIGVSPSLPSLTTDPMHLRQILVNLVSNAIRFTAEGSVAIRARIAPPTAAPAGLAAAAAHPWIVLQVVDTGVGIAPADQERVFDEFEQVNAGSRTNSMQRGTGLGLAISRRLARLLGGDITVTSALGKGTTFEVWLPLPIEPIGSPVPDVVPGPAAGEDVARVARV